MQGGKSPTRLNGNQTRSVSDIHGKGIAVALELELGLGVELLVSNKGSNEQGARFGASVVEIQAMLLSATFSQHPAPLHVSAHAFTSNPPQIADCHCILWGTQGPSTTLGCCCTLLASCTPCSRAWSCATSPEELHTSLLLPQACTLLLVNNKSEVLPLLCC